MPSAEPPLNAPGARAEGSPGSLHPCSVTSAAAVLCRAPGISSCWGLPQSVEITLSRTGGFIGQSFMTKLDLELITKLREADETGQRSSGQVVTAPLLGSVVSYYQQAGSLVQPEESVICSADVPWSFSEPLGSWRVL